MARTTAASASAKPAAKKRAASPKAKPAKKAAAKKTVKKVTAKKAAPKKAAAKKVTAKKAAPKKAAAKKVTAKKAAPKKAAAKKVTAKKAAPKKAAAKKAAPKKAAAKKAAKPATSRKATAKAPTKKAVAAKKAATPKAASPKKASRSKSAPAAAGSPAKSDTASEPAAPEQTEGARGRRSVSRPKSTPTPQVVVGPELRRRVTSVRRLIGERWSTAESELRSGSPFEMLCATILAAQCTDKKVNEISPLLFAEYPDAPALARADIERVKQIIHPTGFFNNKAKALLGMAQKLVQSHAGQVPSRMEDLIQLPGVGRKTAWCVLSRYFGQSGHIVDTHFARVTQRLGFHGETDPLRIEAAMDELVPAADRSEFSNGVVLHGRYICQAKKPRCTECNLVQLCPSAGIDEP